jgi:hypothetical protein
MRIVILVTLAALSSVPRTALSQAHDPGAHRRESRSHPDSAFKALQSRGARVMGVDQYTSTHRFEALADGGRIELQRDVEDSAGVRTIRDHLQSIARQFAEGDFSAATAVHARAVPGTAVMRAQRKLIGYEVRPLPRGGELRITTRDPGALRAVHEFLAFQRGDHRTGER